MAPELPKLDADLLRESGMQLLTNPLDDEEIRTALQSDVDVICTDDPARVL